MNVGCIDKKVSVGGMRKIENRLLVCDPIPERTLLLECAHCLNVGCHQESLQPVPWQPLAPFPVHKAEG